MEKLLAELKECRAELSSLRQGGFSVAARRQRAYMWKNRIVTDMEKLFVKSKFYIKNSEDVSFKEYAADGIYRDVFALSVETEDLELYFDTSGEMLPITLGAICRHEEEMDI